MLNPHKYKLKKTHKRVNIVTKDIFSPETNTKTQNGGVVFRVSRKLGNNQKELDYVTFTSKGKIKSVQKRANKVERNLQLLNRVGLKIDKGIVVTGRGTTVGNVYFDPTNGKVVAKLDYSKLPKLLTIGYRDRQMPISYGTN